MSDQNYEKLTITAKQLADILDNEAHKNVLSAKIHGEEIYLDRWPLNREDGQISIFLHSGTRLLCNPEEPVEIQVHSQGYLKEQYEKNLARLAFLKSLEGMTNV